MNKTFAEHVTNTAFFLSVSKKQSLYLQHLEANPWESTATYRHGYYERPCAGGRSDPDNWVATYGSLIRKGLVVRVIHDQRDGSGHYEITEAGRLVCALLREAGLGVLKASNEMAA